MAGLSATELAGQVSKAAVAQLQKDSVTIGTTIYGNVLQTSRGFLLVLIGVDAAYLARHVGHYAGAPIRAPALTINRLCGSGFQAVINAAQEIMLGEAEVALAGGTENMSQAPYSVRNIRFGTRYGVE